jgi:hypothetical protein
VTRCTSRRTVDLGRADARADDTEEDAMTALITAGVPGRSCR